MFNFIHLRFIPLLNATLRPLRWLLMWMVFLPMTLLHAAGVNLDSLKHQVSLGKRDTFTVNAARSLAYNLKYEDLPTATQYGLQSIALARQLDFQSGIAKGYQTTGQCYLLAGQQDLALQYFRLGGIVAQHAGLRRTVFQAYLNSGVAYEMKGDYLNSVRAQLLARKMALEMENMADVMDCEFNLGITYYKIGNYDAALAYFEKAGKSYKDSGSDYAYAYASALDAIGNVYVAKKDYLKAQAYYELSIDVATPLENASNLAPKYLNLGSAYYFQEKYPLAVKYMQKACAIALESGQQSVVADCYNNLGDCYRRMGDLVLAESYSLKALSLSKELDIGGTVMGALGNLVEIYAEKGDADKALGYYRELDALKDSLQVDQAAAEIANLRVQFEAEKNEKELQLSQEQTAAAEARADKNKIWILALFSMAMAMLLALIIVLLYYGNRRRSIELQLAQRNAEFAHNKLELERRALRAQMNPHFIFNSLNAIQRLYIEGDLDRAGDYMSDFAQILRKILDHSSNDTISLGAELETLRLYLRLEEARLDGVLAYEIHVDEEIDVYNTQLPPLILQPFVENAIWHGILPAPGQGKLYINLQGAAPSATADHIICTIIDNGVGIETSRMNKSNTIGHESKGIKITQERLGATGSVLTEQLVDGGTKITLKIPVTYD